MALIDRYVRTTASGGGDGSANDDTNAWTLAEAISNYVAGQRVNVIEGTYNYGASIVLAQSATELDPILWRGRNSADTGSGRPSFLTDAGIFQLTGNQQIVTDIDVTSDSNGATISISADACLVYRCKAWNIAAGVSGQPHSACLVNDSAVVDCLFVSSASVSSAYTVDLYRGTMTGCKVVTNSVGVRIRNGWRGNKATNSIIIGNGTRYGIHQTVMDNWAAVSTYDNITVYNFENGMYFENLPIIGGSSPMIIQNCLFHTCLEINPSQVEGYAIATEETFPEATTSTTHIINNAYYNCDNGFHNFANHDIGTIQCTQDPFGNVSADDFSLNDLENGGALLRGAGMPLSFSWS